MKLEDLKKAKGIIDEWDEDNFYGEQWCVKAIKRAKDTLECISFDVYEEDAFLGKDDIIERLEEVIDEMCEAISTLQTDEENWTLGI